MNVTYGIMLCHDMDFAIPWIQLHIHGFHWMDRLFSPRSLLRHQREREREMRHLIGHKSDSEPDSFCSKHTIGFSELHTNWITIISQNVICVVILLICKRPLTQDRDTEHGHREKIL